MSPLNQPSVTKDIEYSQTQLIIVYFPQRCFILHSIFWFSAHLSSQVVVFNLCIQTDCMLCRVITLVPSISEPLWLDRWTAIKTWGEWTNRWDRRKELIDCNVRVVQGHDSQHICLWVLLTLAVGHASDLHINSDTFKIG